MIFDFLLILVLGGIALYVVSLAVANKKWYLVFGGVTAAYFVLPTVILQVNWGFHRESGTRMGQSFWVAPYPSDRGAEAASRVAKICGDAEGFNIDGPSVYRVVLPERDEVKHFFYYSKYSNVVWLGIGWEDRYCLARYFLAKRNGGELESIPLFYHIFPFFRWSRESHLVEERLLERIRRPAKAPEGVRSLLPGECIFGDFKDGEQTARFQAEMPNVGQKIRLHLDFGCLSSEEAAPFVRWRKDGRSMTGWIDESGQGGVYEVEVQAPPIFAKRYFVSLDWDEEDSCRRPLGWLYDCEPYEGPDYSKTEDGEELPGDEDVPEGR
ncbi:MAG: hypothetical protein JXP73_22175 [Deltaproteobacteria bacterium]|nr:hypothetical protein [Deltaproteobacteria bacterium]